MRKFSRFLIFFTIWGFLTAFVAIKAYDLGYKHGLERALEIFLQIQKVVQ